MTSNALAGRALMVRDARMKAMSWTGAAECFMRVQVGMIGELGGVDLKLFGRSNPDLVWDSIQMDTSTLAESYFSRFNIWRFRVKGI